MYPSLLENPDVPKQLQVMIYKFSEPLDFSLYYSYDFFFRGPLNRSAGSWALRPSSIKRLAMEQLNAGIQIWSFPPKARKMEDDVP